jgi:hypothetical protein
MSDTEFFYLKTDWTNWKNVTKEQFVSAERAAGFHNTMGQPDEPGTGGFSGHGTTGRIVDTKYAKPSQYDHDPAFRKVVWPKEHCYECDEFVEEGTGEHHGRAGAVHTACISDGP